MNKIWSLILAVALISVLVGCSVDGSNRDTVIRGKDCDRTLSDAELYDKIYGAMYGKCIGLALAQPVEGNPKDAIEKKLRQVDAYPLEYYFPANFPYKNKRFLQGGLDGAPPNDDTTLMMASLLTLRNKGINITSRDIAQTWLDHVGGGCTAEGVALANLKKGIWPPESAIVDNPHRQWIGAQMKAEIWGMIAPALPKVAADYAEQDAMVTHVKNGIYGAQYIAAAVSIAMVEDDPRTVVGQALKVIPSNSEYAQAVKDVAECYDQGMDWEEAWRVLDRRYGFNDDGTRHGDFVEERYNTKKGRYQWGNWRWVHVVPNGGACVLGILYGKGDFSKSICIATMCGYDADCNAGTVGSVVGAMIGQNRIPQKWTAPIHDDFDPGLRAMPGTVKLSELAREITGYAKQVVAEKGNK
ncbi:MAG: ADP-ribosylglycohydrolase family protein [Planctomycetota bacterium]|jgi:ADP-ribosylglycohydrolase